MKFARFPLSLAIFFTLICSSPAAAAPWWWAQFSIGDGTNTSNSGFERWHGFFAGSGNTATDSTYVLSYTWGTAGIATIDGVNTSNDSGLNSHSAAGGVIDYLIGDGDGGAGLTNAQTLSDANVTDVTEAAAGDIMHHKDVYVANKGYMVSSANMTSGGWDSQNNNTILFKWAPMTAMMGKVRNEMEEMAAGTFHDATTYGTINFNSPYGDTVELRYAPEDNDGGTDADANTMNGRLRMLAQGAEESIFYAIDGFSGGVGQDNLAADLNANNSCTVVGVAGSDGFGDWDATNYSNMMADHIQRNQPGSFNRLHTKMMIFDMEVVATGSPNFTASAMYSTGTNDEAQVIVHDFRLARRFMTHFHKVFAEASVDSSSDYYDNTAPAGATSLNVTPTDTAFNLTWTASATADVCRYYLFIDTAALTQAGIGDRVDDDGDGYYDEDPRGDYDSFTSGSTTANDSFDDDDADGVADDDLWWPPEVMVKGKTSTAGQITKWNVGDALTAGQNYWFGIVSVDTWGNEGAIATAGPFTLSASDTKLVVTANQSFADSSVPRGGTAVVLNLFVRGDTTSRDTLQIFAVKNNGGADSKDFVLRLWRDENKDSQITNVDSFVCALTYNNVTQRYQATTSVLTKDSKPARVDSGYTFLVTIYFYDTAGIGDTFQPQIDAKTCSSYRRDSGPTSSITGQGIFTIVSANQITVANRGDSPSANVAKGETIVVMQARIGFTTPSDTLTKFSVTNLGTMVNADVTSIQLFEDARSDSTFIMGTDTLIGAIPFASGSTWTNNALSYTLASGTTAVNVLVVARVATGATGGRTWRSRIDANVVKMTNADTGPLSTVQTSATFTIPADTLINLPYTQDWEGFDSSPWAHTDSWSLSTVTPIGGTYSFKAIDENPSINGEAYASVGMNLTLGTDSIIWEFSMKNGAWDPSSTNNFRVFLFADTSNFETVASPRGYAVGIDITGTTDKLELARMSAGQSYTQLIATAADAWGNSTETLVTVVRGQGGRWMLYMDSVLIGQATDNTHDTSTYFGPHFIYTTSRSGEFWLDSISIRVQTPPAPETNPIVLKNSDIADSTRKQGESEVVAATLFIQGDTTVADTLTKFAVKNVGSADSRDVRVRLYLDDGDSLVDAADSLVGTLNWSETMSAWEISPSNMDTARLGTAGKTFLVTLYIYDTATIGDTFKARIDTRTVDVARQESGPLTGLTNSGAITFAAANQVAVISRGDSPNVTINKGDSAVVMQLKLSVDLANDTLTRFSITNLGTMASSDVSLVQLFEDARSDSTFIAGQDTIIAEIPFSSGSTWLKTGLADTFIGTAETMLVVITTSTGATGGRTWQSRIDANSAKTTRAETGPLSSVQTASVITILADTQITLPYSETWEDFDSSPWTHTDSWQLSTTTPIGGTYSLKHLGDGVDADAYASVRYGYTLGNDTVVWDFAMKNGAWDPSSTNKFWVYLYSDTLNLDPGSAVARGYAVGIDISGSGDQIQLARFDDGVATVLVQTSGDSWTNGGDTFLTVYRGAGGSWELYADSKLIGATTDQTHDTFGYFGVYFDYTAGRSGELWLDSIAIRILVAPPPETNAVVLKNSNIPDSSRKQGESLIVAATLFIQGDTTVADTLTKFAVRNVGLADSRDVRVRLYLDDGDSLVDAADSLVGTLNYSDTMKAWEISPSNMDTARLGTGGKTFLVELYFYDTAGIGDSFQVRVDTRMVDVARQESGPLTGLTNNGIITVAAANQLTVLNRGDSPYKIVNKGDSVVVMQLRLGVDQTNDTLTRFAITNLGSMGTADITSIQLYEDAGSDSTFIVGVDTLIAEIPFSSGSTWQKTGFADTFLGTTYDVLVVASIATTATDGRWFRGLIGSNTIDVAKAETGPLSNVTTTAQYRVAIGAVNIPWSDTFEIGDSIYWQNTDSWQVSTTTPIGGAYSLKHLGDGATSEAYAYIQTPISIALDTVIWEFGMKNGNFDPTSANRFSVILYSDTNILLSTGSQNGYAVGVNLTGTADQIQLTRKAAGVDSELIQTTGDSWNANDSALFTVKRGAGGRWELFVDSKLVGRATENTYTTATYFGVFFDYTTSNSGGMWFDSFSIKYDSVPPDTSMILTKNAAISDTFVMPEKDTITVIAFRLTGDTNPFDTLVHFTIENLGRMDTGDVSRLALWMDVNKDSVYSTGDSFIANLTATSSRRWEGISLNTRVGRDSDFVVTLDLANATNHDTFQARIPADSSDLASFDTGPALAVTENGIVTVSNADSITMLISEVSPDDAPDFVELLMLSDGSGGAGIDISGWVYSDSDGGDKTIGDTDNSGNRDTAVILKTGQFLVIWNAAGADSDNSGAGNRVDIYDNSALGIVTTDDQAIIKDPRGRIRDAMAYSNRDGSASSGELTSMLSLINSGEWTGFDTQGSAVNGPVVGSITGGLLSMQRDSAMIDRDSYLDWGFANPTPGETTAITTGLSAPAVVTVTSCTDLIGDFGGVLDLRWTPDTSNRDFLEYRVYVDSGPIGNLARGGTQPYTTVTDSSSSQLAISGRVNGASYWVSITTVDSWGQEIRLGNAETGPAVAYKNVTGVPNILISEVFFSPFEAGKDTEFIELRVISDGVAAGNLNIAGFKLTADDTTTGDIITFGSLTVSDSDFVVVWNKSGTTESDSGGDGIVNIYTPQAAAFSLAMTDEGLFLIHSGGDTILDFVTWSNRDGSPTAAEQTHTAYAIQRSAWTDSGTSQNNAVSPLLFATFDTQMSITRDRDFYDNNSETNWALDSPTTPGARPNTSETPWVSPAIVAGLAANDVVNDLGGQIKLSWTRGTEVDSSHYNIYISTIQLTGNLYDTERSPSDTARKGDTEKTIQGLTDSTLYYFMVTLVDTAGNEFKVGHTVVSESSVPGPIDTNLPNVWYVNDSFTTNDSFTLVTGADTQDGLSRSSPLLTLKLLSRWLTEGDTVYIDAGTYPETFAIDTNQLWIRGVDSTLTILDFGDSSNQQSKGISATGRSKLWISNLRIQNSYVGIELSTVTTSRIERVTTRKTFARGVSLLTSSSDSIIESYILGDSSLGIVLDASSINKIESNTVSGNRLGIRLISSSDNNDIVGNIIRNSQSYGVELNASSDNRLYQNTFDSNGSWAVYLTGTSANDTIEKNNFERSQGLPDSVAFNNTSNGFNFRRNWYGSADSGVIGGQFAAAGFQDTITYIPFRLGLVDTALYADTVAPRAPDTVAVTAIGDTSLRVSWSVVTASEEPEAALGLSAYRVYASRNRDTTLWVKRGDVASASQIFVDSGFGPAETWYFRLTAVDGSSLENQSFLSDSIIGAATTNETQAPDSFSLRNPSTNVETKSATIAFRWDATNDTTPPITYNLIVDTDAVIQTPYILDTTISGTTTTVSLPGNETYFWRVIARDSFGNAGSAGDSRFVVDTGSPDSPLLLTPRQGEETSAQLISFDWSTVVDTISGIRGYHIQIDTGGTFTNGSIAVDSDQSATSDTQISLPAETYFWRVYTIDDAGNTSPYTSDSSFKIDKTAPVIVSVTFVSSDSTFFSDSGGIDTTQYEDTVFFNNSGGGETQTDTIIVVVTGAESVVIFSNNFGAAQLLDYATAYENGYTILLYHRDTIVTIIARDTAGNQDSVVINWRQDTFRPETVVQLNPSNGATTGDSTPSFNWSAAKDTQSVLRGYHFQFSGNQAFSPLLEDSFVYTTSYTIETSGLIDSTFYWRVVSYDTVSNADTSLAVVRSLVIDSGVPAITQVTVVSSATTHFYADTPVTPGLSADTVYFNPTGAGANQRDTITVFVQDINESQVVGDTAFTVIQRVDSGANQDSYEIVYVIPQDSSSVTIAFVATDISGNQDTVRVHFQMDTAGPIFSGTPLPGNTTETTSETITIDWITATDTAAGLSGYRLQLDTGGFFASGSMAIDSTTGLLGSTSVNLPVNAVYYWRVIATDNVSNTTALSTRFFTIDTLPPTVAIPLLPAIGYETTVTTLAFSWIGSSDSLAGLNRHQLQIDTSGAFSQLTVDSNVGGGTSVVESLPANETYFWRVVSYDDVGNTSATTAETFVIDTRPPTVAVLLTPASLFETSATTISFTWTASSDSQSGLNRHQIQIDTAGTFIANKIDSSVGQNANTSFVLPGSETYYWRIVSYDDLGNTAATSAFSFIVDTKSPTAPTVVAPVSGTETKLATIQFTWTGGSDSHSGLSRFQFQLDTSGAFTTMIADSNAALQTDTSFTLRVNDTYYWRLVAYDQVGNTGVSTTATLVIDTLSPVIDTLVSPVNGDTVSQSVALNWNAANDSISGPASYTVQVDTFGTFASYLAMSGTQASPDTTIILTIDTIYYWRIIATDGAGNTVVSNFDSFRIVTSSDTIKPLAFRLLAPPQNRETSEVTITFSWYDSNDSTLPLSYRLLVDTEVAISGSFAVDTTVTTNTSATVALTPNYTYYWRVIASDPLGNTIAATSDSILIVDTMSPASAGLLNPPAGQDTKTNSIAFRWTAASDTGSGLSYQQLQVSNLSTFVTKAVDSSVGTGANTTVILAANDTYYWRIIAYDDVGNTSVSSTDTFLVDTMLPILPVLANPPDDVDTNRATIQFLWSSSSDSISGFAKHQIQIDTRGQFTYMVVDSSAGAQTDSTFTLPANETYYWRIVAYDQAGNTVAANADSFTIDTVSPILAVHTAPSVGTETNRVSIAFTWTSSADTQSGLQRHQIQIDTGGIFAAGSLAVDSSTGLAANTTVVLRSNDTYYWRVVSYDNAGNTSATTAGTVVIDTLTPTTPTLDTPVGGIDTASPILFNWNASNDSISGVRRYNLQVDTTGSFSGTFAINIFTTTPDTTQIISGLATFYWRVIAEDDAGNTSATSAGTFVISTTDTRPPDTFTLTSPANNTDTKEVTITFRWSDSKDSSLPIQYKLHVDTGPNGGASVETTVTTSTSVTVTLAANDTYVWRVTATDANGNTTVIGDSTVSVDTSGPTTPALVSPVGGDSQISPVALSWNASSDLIAGFKEYRIQVDTTGLFTTFMTADSTQSTTGLSISLATKTTYFWRVVAFDNLGNTTATTADSFKYITATETVPPDPFSLTSPSAGKETREVSVTFRWKDSKDSTTPLSYHLIVDTDMSGGYVADTDVAGTSATLVLPPNDTYKWRVVVQDANANTTAIGDSTIVIDTVGPSRPTQSAPLVGETVNLSAFFDWSDATDSIVGVNRYRVQVDTSGNFGSLLAMDSYVGSSYTTATFETNLYYWRVITEDDVGNTSVTATETFYAKLPDTTAPKIASAVVNDAFVSNIGTETVVFTVVADDSNAVATVLINLKPIGQSESTAFTQVDSVTWTLTVVFDTRVTGDTYDFRIVVSDPAGNQAESTVRVVVADTSPSLAIVNETPVLEQRLAGDAVSILSSYGDTYVEVRYEYRALGDSWTLLKIDNQAPFWGAYWNVSTINTGTYDVRAVGKDANGVVDTNPSFVRVMIDRAESTVHEYTDVTSGNHVRRQRFFSDSSSTMIIADGGTTLEIDSAIIDDSVWIRVEALDTTPETAPISSSLLVAKNGTFRVFLREDGKTSFKGNVLMGLPYEDTDPQNDFVGQSRILEAQLGIYHFDPQLGIWVKEANTWVDPTTNTAFAIVNHFTLFAVLASAAPEATLDSLIIYPNPFIPYDGNDRTGQSYVAGVTGTGITFDNLTTSVDIVIYSIAGRVVARLSKRSGTTDRMHWDARNEDGRELASGVYVAVITSSTGQRVVRKIMIIR